MLTSAIYEYRVIFRIDGLITFIIATSFVSFLCVVPQTGFYCLGLPKVKLPTTCPFNSKARAPRAIRYYF